MTDSPLPSSFGADREFFEESRFNKFTRKIREEPLIPVGMAVTCWALVSAARNIRKGGDPNQTNRFFRYRLYAQSFTLCAMVGGSYYYNADRLKRSEYRKLKKKQDEQEKRSAWIRELEIREEEDKEWREKLGIAKDSARARDEQRVVEEARREKEASTYHTRPELEDNDDGRRLLTAVRRQHNEAKGGQERMLEIEKRGTMMRAPGEQVKTTSETKIREAEQSGNTTHGDYESWFGESEAGGFMGYKHLKAFIERRFK